MLEALRNRKKDGLPQFCELSYRLKLKAPYFFHAEKLLSNDYQENLLISRYNRARAKKLGSDH
jgi:hypothetical protein